MNTYEYSCIQALAAVAQQLSAVGFEVANQFDIPEMICA